MEKKTALKLITIKKSTVPSKKYTAVFLCSHGKIKTTHFGATGYEDFTMHRDPQRKISYQQRHQHNKLNDPTSAGALSWYILWNKPTVKASIASYRKHFGI